MEISWKKMGEECPWGRGDSKYHSLDARHTCIPGTERRSVWLRGRGSPMGIEDREQQGELQWTDPLGYPVNLGRQENVKHMTIVSRGMICPPQSFLRSLWLLWG